MAMKRDNEALNVSKLQFLRNVKHFIASLLRFFFLIVQRLIVVTFFKDNGLMLHRRCFLKEIYCLTFNRRYFFTVTLPTSADWTSAVPDLVGELGEHPGDHPLKHLLAEPLAVEPLRGELLQQGLKGRGSVTSDSRMNKIPQNI
jgi:hypothetical protein